MVVPGMPLPAYELAEVPTEPMKTMALLLRDPNPIHFDRAAVADLGLGDRVINQGPTNMAYMVNMLVEWLDDPSAIRSLKLRFLDNVRGGDAIVAGGVVTGTASEGQDLVAQCDVWLDVVDGARALAGTATVLVSGGSVLPD